MIKDNFVFDEKTHAYILNERPLPSVSHIVSNVLNLELPDEWYLRRGSMVHLAISLYLNNNLNEDTIDPRIQGYFESAKKAIKELKIQPAVIEKPLYHKSLLFAGTPDLLTNQNILIDWKTGNNSQQSEPQLGGYSLLLEANGHRVKKVYEITLDDKNYKIFEHKPHRCKGLFTACLTIYQFKNNHI